MGFFDRLKKRKEANVTPLPDWADPNHPIIESRYTVKSFDPQSMAGFGFSNVPVYESVTADRDTGEVEETRDRICLIGDNLFRAISALDDIAPAMDASEDHVDDWVPIGQWLPELIQAAASTGGDSLTYTASMTYEPLTPTGRPKKVPILVDLDVRFTFPIVNSSHPGALPFDSATCRIWFRNDGAIEKAQISYFGNHADYGICSNTIDDKGDQALRKVRAMGNGTGHKWRQLFPPA